MVVGGRDDPAHFDVEVIDLSGNMRSCAKPADSPQPGYGGMTGAYFKGFPTVCGGYSHVADCNQYDYRV